MTTPDSSLQDAATRMLSPLACGYAVTALESSTRIPYRQLSLLLPE